MKGSRLANYVKLSEKRSHAYINTMFTYFHCDLVQICISKGVLLCAAEVGS